LAQWINNFFTIHHNKFHHQLIYMVILIS
jgi:hypothetical protein